MEECFFLLQSLKNEEYSNEQNFDEMREIESIINNKDFFGNNKNMFKNNLRQISNENLNLSKNPQNNAKEIKLKQNLLNCLFLSEIMTDENDNFDFNNFEIIKIENLFDLIKNVMNFDEKEGLSIAKKIYEKYNKLKDNNFIENSKIQG